MLPARAWIPFLEQFSSAFARAYGQKPEGCTQLPAPPTFSAGVVIAHTHFPIGEYFRIGKSLQKSAKGDKGVNSVDWEIISSSMLDDPIAERESIAEQGRGRRRTAKPYRLTDLLELGQQVAGLREAGPSTKVNMLYRTAFAGTAQAEMDYLYLLSRLDRDCRERVIAGAGSHVWQRLASGREVTRLADFAELWEFV